MFARKSMCIYTASFTCRGLEVCWLLLSILMWFFAMNDIYILHQLENRRWIIHPPWWSFVMFYEVGHHGPTWGSSPLFAGFCCATIPAIFWSPSHFHLYLSATLLLKMVFLVFFYRRNVAVSLEGSQINYSLTWHTQPTCNRVVRKMRLFRWVLLLWMFCMDCVSWYSCTLNNKRQFI